MAERSAKQFPEFTWFDKFTRITTQIEDNESRIRFIAAIVDYATLGVEPELEFPYNVFFETIRDDIENSLNARGNNKGGRPPKKPPVSEGDKPEETGGSEENENLEKPPVSEGSETSENPFLYKPMPKPSPIPKPKPKSKGAKKFAPPSREEAEAYKAEAGLTETDVGTFLDYYEANGWKQSNGNPIKDWKATMRNWNRRQKTFRSSKSKPQTQEVNPEYAQYCRPDW